MKVSFVPEFVPDVDVEVEIGEGSGQDCASGELSRGSSHLLAGVIKRDMVLDKLAHRRSDLELAL